MSEDVFSGKTWKNSARSGNNLGKFRASAEKLWVFQIRAAGAVASPIKPEYKPCHAPGESRAVKDKSAYTLQSYLGSADESDILLAD